MRITHTPAQSPENTKSYPKLMKSNKGNIVLFSGSRKGTVIVAKNVSYGSTNRKVGEYRTDWDMVGFKDLPLADKVTLTNAA